ncbi:MAG: COG2426 family protein [Bacillota bacterium]|jgi:uncharacterized membrane protein
MIDSIVNSLGWLSPEWIVFFVSMLPVVELRGAIPIGMAFGLPAWESFLLSVAGNGLITVLLLLILPKFFELLYKISPLEPFLDKLIQKTRHKGKDLNKKGALGLFLFVAIPLPGTGVWTGCLIAYLMGMRIRYSLLSVVLGMVLAGILMTLGSLGLFTVVGDIEAALIVLLVLVVLIYAIQKVRQKKDKAKQDL